MANSNNSNSNSNSNNSNSNSYSNNNKWPATQRSLSNGWALCPAWFPKVSLAAQPRSVFIISNRKFSN